ncbi:hypothetical protein L3Q82_018330 [Scortum barcoo]|uniref:Uncharacterized protein n=1 Tax=Scortum barcoo TaxID=214431 RepID=A0ACB8VKS0_9TELE|nr:hypothetical protein L3Q82_018330 [Scortum barcoo]
MFWFIPWLDVIHRVDLRTVSFNIQPQEVLTADGVLLKLDAVVFYRVVDPSLWVMRVKNGLQATCTLARTTLRATVGAHTLTDVLTQSTDVTMRVEEVLHAAATLWGVQVERVELKALSLPKTSQVMILKTKNVLIIFSSAVTSSRLSLSCVCEMIVAEGELKASHVLKEAAWGLPPVAFHLRYLQSLSSIQSSATSIVVFSLPTKLLEAFISRQL